MCKLGACSPAAAVHPRVLEHAPVLTGISLKYGKNMLSSPIEQYLKVAQPPGPCGGRDHAHLHHIFASAGRPVRHTVHLPRPTRGPRTSLGLRRKASRGRAHRGNPPGRWDKPRPVAWTSRAAAAPVRLAPTAARHGCSSKVDPGRAWPDRYRGAHGPRHEAQLGEAHSGYTLERS